MKWETAFISKLGAAPLVISLVDEGATKRLPVEPSSNFC